MPVGHSFPLPSLGSSFAVLILYSPLGEWSVLPQDCHVTQYLPVGEVYFLPS